MAHAADEIYASKGKKLVHVNLKQDQPSDEALAAILLGPTGNLRAPAFIAGRKLVIGFDEQTYRKLLC